ncbi:MAG: PASTA domain-containing protein, partial [Gemmatimonadaceae bacterium]
PVSKTLLVAAIAARDAALTREGLASAPQRVAAAPPSDEPVRDVADEVVVTESAGSVPYEVSLGQPIRVVQVVAGARAVPPVTGLSRRAAARVLHRAGFRVAFARGDRAAQWPAAGAVVPAGSRVTVTVAP